MSELNLEEVSQEERIRTHFAALASPMSIRDFARTLVESGEFDEMQLEAFQIKGAVRRVSQALKSEDGNGRPFALPIEPGQHARWLQYELFQYKHFIYAIGERVKQGAENFSKARLLQEDCRARFGTAPSVPDVME